MRRAERPSWQITVDVPQVLAVALYVRDVAGVTQTAPPAELPQTAPPVAADRTAAPSPELTAQWNRWWTRALTVRSPALRELEPPYPAFADAPALRALLRVHAADALRWSGERKRSSVGPSRRGLPLGELVAEVERDSGRAAAPFELRLDVVPVAGHGVWEVRPAHLLVAAALLDDPRLLASRLRPELERLA